MSCSACVRVIVCVCVCVCVCPCYSLHAVVRACVCTCACVCTKLVYCQRVHLLVQMCIPLEVHLHLNTESPINFFRFTPGALFHLIKLGLKTYTLNLL